MLACKKSALQVKLHHNNDRKVVNNVSDIASKASDLEGFRHKLYSARCGLTRLPITINIEELVAPIAPSVTISRCSPALSAVSVC